MTMANPAEIGAWAYDAGFRDLGVLTEAIALAGAHPASENDQGGEWGVGGPVGDGPGQARVAYTAYQASQWSTFPARNSPLTALLRPGAAAVASAVILARRGQDAAGKLPNPTDVINQALTPIKAVAEAAASGQRIADFLTEPSTWVRGVKILTGVIIIGAAWMIVWQGGIASAGKKALGVASSVTGKGRSKKGSEGGKSGGAGGGTGSAGNSGGTTG